MTISTGSGIPFVLDATGIAREDADAVLDGAVVADAEAAVIEVTGPGAVPCLQGLLTNDVDRPGPNAFVYGAVLTPKGMILCDAWVVRDGGRFLVTAPRHGLDILLEAFGRSLPPRLAKFTDRTHEFSVLRLAGPVATVRAREAGIEVPEAARSLTAIVAEAACLVARPDDASAPPFEVQILVTRDECDRVRDRLGEAGVASAHPHALELVRVLRGWPRLGAEIGEKTLPQEVRFDALGGVSYTKGCYVGQETVARVHFRGHPNRELVGLVWDEAPAFDHGEVLQEGRVRGQVTTAAWLAPVERYVGLALVRRTVDHDRAVTAAGAPAALQDLPFDVDG